MIWHEVCHLEVMDHSPRFWGLVARRCPDTAIMPPGSGATPAPWSCDVCRLADLAAIRALGASSREQLVVAIDGHGAAGKTTIACEVAVAREALVVHTDDYFEDRVRMRPGPDPMARYYDWRCCVEIPRAATNRGGRP